MKKAVRQIFTTTITKLKPLNNGWIIGDKMPRDKFPELYSPTTFVKLSSHKPNEKSGQRPDAISTKKSTLVVLFSGQIEHTFYESNGVTIKKTKLSKKGDILYYGPNIKHTWTVTKPNTEILTIQFIASSLRNASASNKHRSR